MIKILEGDDNTINDYFNKYWFIEKTDKIEGDRIIYHPQERLYIKCINKTDIIKIFKNLTAEEREKIIEECKNITLRRIYTNKAYYCKLLSL